MEQEEEKGFIVGNGLGNKAARSSSVHNKIYK
jgi:hypothetical protein